MSELLDNINNALEETPLSNKQRNELADGDFAIPRTRKYPIHDVNHARNALARVSKMGTEDEKERVRAAVAKRYPDINKKQEAKEDEKPSVVAVKITGENADKFEPFIRKVAGLCNGGSSRYLAVVEHIGDGKISLDDTKLEWAFDGDGNTRIAVGRPEGLQIDECGTDMNCPEEKQEVKIARSLLNLSHTLSSRDLLIQEMTRLANELLALHGAP